MVDVVEAGFLCKLNRQRGKAGLAKEIDGVKILAASLRRNVSIDVMVLIANSDYHSTGIVSRMVMPRPMQPSRDIAIEWRNPRAGN